MAAKADATLDGPTHVWDSILVGGARRSFIAFYPPASGDPTGLVIFLHYLGGLASQWSDALHLAELTQSLGFVAICPQAEVRALPDRLARLTAGNATKTYWRAFPGFGYGFRANDGVEDLDFLEALVEWANARAVIPPRRTFLLGCSNGGSLAYRVACERPARFDGIAVLSQQFAEDGFDNPGRRNGVALHGGARSALAGGRRCEPSKSLPLWTATGTEDQYYGATARPSWENYSRAVLGCREVQVRKESCREMGGCSRSGGEGTLTRSRFCTGNWSHVCDGTDISAAILAAWTFWVPPLADAAPADLVGRLRGSSMSWRSGNRTFGLHGAALVWTKVFHCGRRRCRMNSTTCEADPTCRATIACAEGCGMPGTRRFARCYEHRCVCERLRCAGNVPCVCPRTGDSASSPSGRIPANLVPGQTNAAALALFDCLRQTCDGIGRTEGA